MRILVLVLAARAWPYPILVRTIKRTWASRDTADVSTLFYYGGKRLELEGRNLHLPVTDALPAGLKTIACFEQVLESNEFDLIFRMNCSSYVDLPNLRGFAERHARATGFYSGRRGMFGDLPFASGSGYFLSRDLVELVVERRDEWNHELPDDIALAELMRGHRVDLVDAPRVDYTSAHDVGDVDTSQFLFRCKTESPWRLGDIRILLMIHEAFGRARGRRSRSVALPVMSAMARLYAASLRLRRRQPGG